MSFLGKEKPEQRNSHAQKKDTGRAQRERHLPAKDHQKAGGGTEQLLPAQPRRTNPANTRVSDFVFVLCCNNRIPQTGKLGKKFIFHSSGDWKVQH